MGSCYTVGMRIIARKTLRDFWETHPDSEQSLRAWFHDTKVAAWTGPTAIRALYTTASFLANNRVVFNIHGNRYRLIVTINNDYQVVYIRFIGSHAEYDWIDAATI
jgi:mRNA interferase HigB